MPNHRSAINSHQMHRVEDQITSEIHEGNYRPVHNKPCMGGGGAGGVPDHDSQRKKTPFHISRGK